MCIIASKPKGVSLKKEVYETMFKNNSDGAGFIVRERTGELLLKKGFFTFKDFWENFQPHQHKQAIVHFRITTHGDTNETNCHPFWVEEGKLAFAHNGVISNVAIPDASLSDTWHFNTTMLKHLNAKLGTEFIDDPVLQDLIAEYIGWSKLAFMHEDGRVWIFNKKQGTVEGNVWYSNYSYRQYKAYTPPALVTPALANKVNNALTEAANEQDIEDYYSEKYPHLAALSSVPNVKTSPKSFGPSVNSTLRIDDYIEMTEHYKDLAAGAMGLVKAFLDHGMIQVKMWDTGKVNSWKMRAVPMGSFRKYQDGSGIQPDITH